MLVKNNLLFFFICVVSISCGANNQLKKLQAKYDSLQVVNNFNVQVIDSLTEYINGNTDVDQIILVSSICNSKECLLSMGNELYFGITTFKGYYAEDADNNCDGLIITGGKKEVLKMYRDLIQKGNSVNKLSDNNELILNVDLGDLDRRTADFIRRTDVNNQVGLRVMIGIPEGVCVDPCFSFFTILETELYPTTTTEI